MKGESVKVILAGMSAMFSNSLLNDNKYMPIFSGHVPKQKKIPTKRPKSKQQKKSRKKNRGK